MLFSIFDGQACLVDPRGGTEFGLDEFAQKITARAEELKHSGIGHGRSVVVAQPAPLDYLRDIFALWEVGAMAVAVNPSITTDERKNVLEATQAAFILDDTPLVASNNETHSNPGPLDVDAPALTLMTSGTTGKPKGIVHTQRSLAARVALNIAAIGKGDLARSLSILPMHFGHGLIGNVFTPMAAGGRLYLWPQPSIEEIRTFGPFIDEHKMTFMSSTPSFWNIATRLSAKPEHHFKRVHVGSAPLSIEQWHKIAEFTGTQRVFNMYGMTETANWIGGACLEDKGAADGLVGHAWGGAMALLDDQGEIIREGSGEVLISTPSMMMGYFGMDDATKAAFHGDWLRTGDIGRIDADGQLTLVGRIKHEINRGGVKVPAEEIDMLLERHPAIKEACAFGLPDPVAGEAVAAAIVLGEHVEAASIREWCGERCRSEAVPSRLFVIDAIPRNDRGKIVRDHVRETALASGSGE